VGTVSPIIRKSEGLSSTSTITGDILVLLMCLRPPRGKVRSFLHRHGTLATELSSRLSGLRETGIDPDEDQSPYQPDYHPCEEDHLRVTTPGMDLIISDQAGEIEDR